MPELLTAASQGTTASTPIAAAQFLVVTVEGDGQRYVVQLADDETVMVGTHDQCGIRVLHPDVSSRQCLISWRQQQIRLLDWSAGEPTCLNGQPVELDAAVAPHDRLNFAVFNVHFEVVRAGQAAASDVESTAAPIELAQQNTTPSTPETHDLAPSSDVPYAEPPTFDADAEWTDAAEPELASPADWGAESYEAVEQPAEQSDTALGNPPPVADWMGWDRMSSVAANDASAEQDQLQADFPATDEPLLGWPQDEASFAPGDQLDSDDHASMGHPESVAHAADDSVQADTIALLAGEIELLQTELAAKNAELADRQAPTPEADSSAEPVWEERVSQLLVELESSEQRVNALEDVLRLSDEARAAESEEKQQIEAWVSEIEHRIAERETEMQAECQTLRRRCEQAQRQYQRAQNSVQQVLQSARDTGDDPLAQVVATLRQENAELRQRLIQQAGQLETVQDENQRLQRELAEHGVEQQIEAALRKERLERAQERAAFVRKQVEISAKLTEMKTQLEKQSRLNAADERFQAFRETLQELHQKEKEEYVPPTMMQRLGKLWQRLDGPTDRD